MQQRLKLLIVASAVIVVALICYSVYLSMQFHIVKTDPKLSSFPALYNSVTVSFNEVLNPSSIRINDVSGIIDHSQARAKTLTIYFKDFLTVNSKYTIVLTSVKSIDGSVITNKKLVFTAKDIDFNSLPKNQQNKIVSSQDPHTYDLAHITFTNFDELLDQGLTIGQQTNIKGELYDYSNRVKKQYWEMRLVPNSTVYTQASPDSDSTRDTVDFKVVLGGQTYSAHLDFDALYDAIHMLLTDSSGALVFDSSDTGA